MVLGFHVLLSKGSQSSCFASGWFWECRFLQMSVALLLSFVVCVLGLLFDRLGGVLMRFLVVVVRPREVCGGLFRILGFPGTRINDLGWLLGRVWALLGDSGLVFGSS